MNLSKFKKRIRGNESDTFFRAKYAKRSSGGGSFHLTNIVM